jgi:phenylacetate-CoA ligase
MPFIRYNLGDLGIPTDERCSCGRSWPLIKSIEGRKSDVFIMPNGERIYSHFLKECVLTEIKKNFFIVSQFQIIQEKRNTIMLKIVKGKEFDPKVVDKIKNNIENLSIGMGEDISVETEIVQEISKDKSGKRRTVISMVGSS